MSPCYHPITVYRAITGRNEENGSWPITFNPKLGFRDKELQVPCGKCIGCRLERSRQWAMRCVNEAESHENNCFITLTYDNDHLPKNGSLDKRDYVLFMKRLRKKYGSKIRFFHCGEYGEKFSRPHHHACLFNFDFPDKVHYTTRNGVNLYISNSLMDLWPFGYSTIGDVTFESAAYVARYVTKKINGAMAEKHYQGKQPEYITMSRKPGIGKEWLKKFVSDVYPNDRLVVRKNLVCKPPRYYDKLYDEINAFEMKSIRLRRAEANGIKQNTLLNETKIDNTPERLVVREELQKLKMKELKRSYENVN